MIYMVFVLIRKTGEQKSKMERLESLPDFSLMTVDGKIFDSRDIEKGPVLVVRFHPDCDHCMYEIPDILGSEIPGIVKALILISDDHPDSIKGFMSRYRIITGRSVWILADTTGVSGDIFGDGIPSCYIYNKRLRLVRSFRGEVKAEVLARYLREDE